MSTLLHEFIRKAEEAVSDSEAISNATSYDKESKRLRFGRACDPLTMADRRAEYVRRAETLILDAVKPEILKLAAVLAVESTGLVKRGQGK